MKPRCLVALLLLALAARGRSMAEVGQVEGSRLRRVRSGACRPLQRSVPTRGPAGVSGINTPAERWAP